MPTQLESVLAYLDPGTGSILLQVVAASLLSAGFMVRHWVSRFLHGLLGIFRRSDSRPHR